MKAFSYFSRSILGKPSLLCRSYHGGRQPLAYQRVAGHPQKQVLASSRVNELSALTGLVLPKAPVKQTKFSKVYETPGSFVLDIGPYGIMGEGLMKDLVELPKVLSLMDSSNKPLCIASTGKQFGLGADLSEVFLHTQDVEGVEALINKWVELTYRVKRALWRSHRPCFSVLLPNQKVMGLSFEVFSYIPTIGANNTSIVCPQNLYGIPSDTMQLTEKLIRGGDVSMLTEKPEGFPFESVSRVFSHFVPAKKIYGNTNVKEWLDHQWRKDSSNRSMAMDVLGEKLPEIKEIYRESFLNNADRIEKSIEKAIRSDKIVSRKAQYELKIETDKRMQACEELERVRTRSEQQISHLNKYASEEAVLEILPILDNIDLALKQTKKTELNRDILDGFILIKKQFLKSLEKLHVVRIDSESCQFDPQFHYAVSQEASADHESGTVIRVLQEGYCLHERVIRPSCVVVAS